MGTKVSPRDNSLVSESESCTVERLITVSSSCGCRDLFLVWERVLRLFLFWLMVLVGAVLAVLPLRSSEVVTLCTVSLFSAFCSV